MKKLNAISWKASVNNVLYGSEMGGLEGVSNSEELHEAIDLMATQMKYSLDKIMFDRDIVREAEQEYEERGKL